MTRLPTILALLLLLGAGCLLPSQPYRNGDDDDDASDDDDDDDTTPGDDDDTTPTDDDDTTPTDDDDSTPTDDDDSTPTDDDDSTPGDDDDSTPGDDDDDVSGPALFIEDVDRWATDAWDTALTAEGIPYQTISSSALAATDLTQFSMVVTTSAQEAVYNQRLMDKHADFQAYVVAGGVLIWSGCTWEQFAPFPDPPFSGSSQYYTNDSNTIELPSHPLMDGVQAPYTGTSASHNYFTGIPGNAQVILTDPTYGEPTLYVLEAGTGVLIVSGLPWEFHSGDMLDTMQTLTNAVTWGWGYP